MTVGVRHLGATGCGHRWGRPPGCSEITMFNPLCMKTVLGGPAHEARIELLDRAHAALLHGYARLRVYDIEYALHAFLAKGSQSPQVGPADANRLRAHGERLDRVRAAPESAINHYRNSALHRRDDLRQRVNGGAAIVLASAAMIGHENAVDPVLH